MLIAIYVFSYILIGLLTLSLIIRLDLNKGIDYTLKDLLICLFLATFSGPIMLFCLLYFIDDKKVILKGKKNELRINKNTPRNKRR